MTATSVTLPRPAMLLQDLINSLFVLFIGVLGRSDR